MLGIDDLLVANLAVRMGMLPSEGVRGLLIQLDRAPGRQSLARYLHDQRVLNPGQVKALYDTASRRVRQLQEEAYLAAARAQGFPEPSLQQVSAECARDGFTWQVGTRLMQQHGLQPAHHAALAQEAVRRFAEHENGVLHQNRSTGYLQTVQTQLATTSDQHRLQALRAAAGQDPSASHAGGHPGGSGPLHNSGAYQNPNASGAHNPHASGVHNPHASGAHNPHASGAHNPHASGTGRVSLSPPPNNPPALPPGGPPGPDGEVTIQLNAPATPFRPPGSGDADPDRTITLPAGGLDADGFENDMADPGRTMMFDGLLPTPGGDDDDDDVDGERTINLPPHAAGADPNYDPFKTVQTSGLGPGGAGPPPDPDRTITFNAGDVADAASEGQIGDYELIRELGRGNMGVVHLAKSPQGDFVAIKVIQARADNEMRARFEREIKVSQHIEHDHVIRVLDNGQLPDGSSYLVMEYLEGQELREHMQAHGPVPAEQALEMLEQLAAGLAAVHQARIVHRDLKPENVQVLQRYGSSHLKLVDFGIARFLDQQEQDGELFVTMRGTLSGTPAYVAPEAVLDPEEIRPSHDVYAAGVIFYELLTGGLPFPPGRTLRDMLTDTLHSRPRPLEEANPQGAPYSERVQGLIRRLLEKDPMLRPQDGAELLQVIAESRQEGGPTGGGQAPSKRRSRVAAAQARKPGFTARLMRSITGLFKRQRD